jgi:hypothetical protein
MFLNEDRDDVAFLTGSGSSEYRIKETDWKVLSWIKGQQS